MTEDLINLVRQHQILYNSSLKDYKDFPLRNEAWEEIAFKLKIPADQCKETWSKLRNAYSNAMKRRRKRNSGAEPMTAWKYEEQMSFLQPYTESRSPTNLSSNLVSQMPLQEDQLIESIEIGRLSPQFFGVEDSQSFTEHSVKIEPRDINKSANDALQKWTSSGMDEMDHFLCSMGKAIKLLPKIDQIRIKFDLHKAVYDAQVRQIADEAKEQEEKKRRIWKEH